jgi:hypothetical protein
MINQKSQMFNEEPGDNTDTGDGTGTGDGTDTDTDTTYWKKTIEGLTYSFTFIFLSEVGDKTFLFIVLYATRMNGMKLLIASSIGLCAMHVLATGVGSLFKYILSSSWIKLITIACFFVFG